MRSVLKVSTQGQYSESVLWLNTNAWNQSTKTSLFKISPFPTPDLPLNVQAMQKLCREQPPFSSTTDRVRFTIPSFCCNSGTFGPSILQSVINPEPRFSQILFFLCNSGQSEEYVNRTDHRFNFRNKKRGRTCRDMSTEYATCVQNFHLFCTFCLTSSLCGVPPKLVC